MAGPSRAHTARKTKYSIGTVYASTHKCGKLLHSAYMHYTGKVQFAFKEYLRDKKNIYGGVYCTTYMYTFRVAMLNLNVIFLCLVLNNDKD